MRLWRLAVGLCLIVLTLTKYPPGVWPIDIGDFSCMSNHTVMAYADVNTDGMYSIVNTQHGHNHAMWQQTDSRLPLALSLMSEANVDSIIAAKFNQQSSCTIVVTAFTEAELKSISLYDIDCKMGCTGGQPYAQMQIGQSPVSVIRLDGQNAILFEQEQTLNVLFGNQTQPLLIKPLSQWVNGSTPTAYSSSFFGDYDGDCLPDLVFETPNSLTFLKKQSGGPFINIATIQFEISIHSFTFVDVNSDGKNDLVLMFNDSYAQIHYHRVGFQKKLCQSGMQNLEDLPYDFILQEGKVAKIQRLSLPDKPYPHTYILAMDFNRDRYPDFAVTYTNKTTGRPYSLLYESRPCEGPTCGQFNPSFTEQWAAHDLRSFFRQLIHLLRHTLNTIEENSISLSFYDLYMDGRMDVVLNIYDSQTGFTRVQFLENSLFMDSFFLSVRVNLMGTDQSLLGLVIGTTVEMFVTTLSGQPSPMCNSLLSQMGQSLQLPEIYLGLGRTNNYVQSFTITDPSSEARRVWSPVVPNSQAIVVMKPAAPTLWSLDAFMKPSSKMGGVFLTVVVSLAILAVVIFKLRSKEKEDDESVIDTFYSLLN